MRLDNALRWQRLWWFLSLNVVREFSLELRLPSSITDLQEQLRNRIDPETDLPTYGSDPRWKAYRMLTWFRDTVGEETFNYLQTWQRHVFVQGGEDRVEEFVWDALAYELFHRSAELNLPEAYRSALKQFHEVKAVRLAAFNKRLAEASASKPSIWDQQAIQAEEASLDVVLSTITNVCTSNIFVGSWHEAFTRRGLPFLTEIFEVAQRVASEDVSGRLLFSAEMLPFPSSWEFDSTKDFSGVTV